MIECYGFVCIVWCGMCEVCAAAAFVVNENEYKERLIVFMKWKRSQCTVDVDFFEFTDAVV